MQRAQAQWTPDYLAGLSREGLAANQREQAQAAAPVEKALPKDLLGDWLRLARVQKAVNAAILAAWPASGNGLQLQSEARRLGFPGITAYVMRTPLIVDGESWTWEKLRSTGADVDSRADNYCR